MDFKDAVMPYQLRVTPPARSIFLTLTAATNCIPSRPKATDAGRPQFERCYFIGLTGNQNGSLFFFGTGR